MPSKRNLFYIKLKRFFNLLSSLTGYWFLIMLLFFYIVFHVNCNRYPVLFNTIHLGSNAYFVKSCENNKTFNFPSLGAKEITWKEERLSF